MNNNLLMYIFIALMIVLLFGLFTERIYSTIYKRKQEKIQTQDNLQNSPENDAQINNHHIVMETKLQILQEELFNQKKELAQLITSFKDETFKQDKEFVAKISAFDSNLKNFEINLLRKDEALKKDLTIQSTNLESKIMNVVENIAKIGKTTDTITSLDEKVQSLQNVFLNSKRRGNLGEYQLDRILSDIYPKSSIWKMQHQLPGTNVVVDAYLNLANGEEGIAIDAKFPFDNYNKHFDEQNKNVQEQYLKSFKQDVKNRINEVAKYIDETNKIKSAIMFIPSEEVFRFIYDKFSDVIDYAFRKHIWISSPTTLSAILFAIDKHVREIETNRNIEEIKKHLLKMQVEFKRWIERWIKFRDTINKVPDRVRELDITHEKIERQYGILLQQDFTRESFANEEKMSQLENQTIPQLKEETEKLVNN